MVEQINPENTERTKNHNRIYIIGMMGSGKSTIGKKLAGLIGYTFIDLDREIEKHEGVSIHQIFEDKGEDYFRQLESEILRACAGNRLVMATGGGTPCYHHNMEFIKSNGISIYLEADEGLICNRITRYPEKRPLLKGMSLDKIRTFVAEKLNEREPYYRQASMSFSVPGITAETIVKSIGYTENGK